MLPVANAVISPVPIQIPLVATAMPNAIATVRVPSDSVSASVFTPPVHNNASGNGGAYAAPVPLAVAMTSAATGGGGAALMDSEAQFWASPQPAFLAQMIGQGVSPEGRSLLALYERLMTVGNVKHKPSNATLPPPDPAGVFGRLLQQEKSASAERIPAPVLPPAPPRQAPAVVAQPVEVARPVSFAQRPSRVSYAAVQKATQAYQTAIALDVLPAPETKAESEAAFAAA